MILLYILFGLIAFYVIVVLLSLIYSGGMIIHAFFRKGKSKEKEE